MQEQEETNQSEIKLLSDKIASLEREKDGQVSQLRSDLLSELRTLGRKLLSYTKSKDSDCISEQSSQEQLLKLIEE